MTLNRVAGLALVALAAAGLTRPACAQISTDGSLGAAQNLAGPNYSIPDNLGLQVGPNLFHSFSDFNVNIGESATFTSGFAGVTDNVISRVTGTNLSNIDGPLNSTIAGADLWLLNPNGIVFGQNASLSVPGSFHATTADYVTMPGGGRFGADLSNPANTILNIASPDAFGFLDATVGSISVTAPAGPSVQLTVPAGETISLIGRIETDLGGGGQAPGLQNAVLSAPGGQIDLVSVTAAGTVTRAGNAAPTLTGFASFGDLELIDSAIDVAGTGGGRIFLFGDTFVVDNTAVTSGTSGAGNAGNIDVRARNLFVVNGGTIAAGTGSTGNGGNIDIRGPVTRARSVTVSGPGSSIASDSTGAAAGSGDAGKILVWTDRMTIDNQADVSVRTVAGRGGRIDLIVERLQINSDASVNASTSGAGDGGAVDVGGSFVGTSGWPNGVFGNLFNTTTETLSIAGGSINLGTSGAGDAGQLVIVANTDVTLSSLDPLGNPSVGRSGIIAESTGTLAGLGTAPGKSGTLVLFAPTITLNELAQISMSTVDGGPQVVTSPAGTGSIALNSDLLTLNGNSSVNASTSGAGDGGSILIGPIPFFGQAAALDLNGGSITTSSTGTGNAGQITIAVDTLDLSGDADNDGVPEPWPSGIFSDSFGAGAAAGQAGRIAITASGMTMSDAAQLSVNTVDGASGTLDLTVASLDINSQAAVTAATSGAGNGGTITVDTGTLTMNGGVISTSTSGTGDAGQISIGTAGAPATAVSLAGAGGAIRSESTAGGPGAGAAGAIAIRADSVVLSNGGRISVDTDDGASGTIGVTAGTLAIGSSAAVSAATTGAGNGGIVDIDAGMLTMQGGSISTSTTGSGDAGRIVIGSSAAPVGSLTLSGGTGAIRSESSAAGPGAGSAGRIEIHAPALNVFDQATVSVSTVDGASGAIDLFVDTLTVDTGATISAATAGVGNGGAINVGGQIQSISLGGGTISTSTSGGGDAGTIMLGAAGSPLPSLSVSGGAIESESTGAGPGAGSAGSITIFTPALIIRDDGRISVATRDGGGGRIALAADSLVIRDGGRVSAETRGDGDGGTIDVDADAIAILAGRITTSASGAGDAGLIRIGSAADPIGTITLAGSGGIIQSDSSGAGAAAGSAGAIEIYADELNILDGGRVSVNTLDGAGGAIDLSAGALRLVDHGSISASTGGAGAGGRISVASLGITVDDGMISTSTAGSGDAGQITIGAQGGVPAVLVTGNDAAIRSDSTASGTAGKAGNVIVNAASLALRDGGRISATTVDGSGSNGEGGAIDLNIGELNISGGARVTAASRGAGTAGTIAIGDSGSPLQSVTIANGGSGIISNSSGSGDAGNITVFADRIALAHGSRISAATFDGAGGSIRLETAGALTIDGAEISTGTTGAGPAGVIDIAADEVFIRAIGDRRGGIFSESGAPADAGTAFLRTRAALTPTGDAGSINLAANSLTLTDGGEVSVRSFGLGNAGSITLGANEFQLLGGSSVNAQTEVGSGGSITINVTDFAFLTDSEILAFSASADPSSQGNIFIGEPVDVILRNSRLRALSDNEAGGNVTIAAQSIIFDATSSIEATGSIFTIGDVLATVLQVDEPEIEDSGRTLATRCTPQQVRDRSTLTVRQIRTESLRSDYFSAQSAALDAIVPILFACAR